MENEQELIIEAIESLQNCIRLLTFESKMFNATEGSTCGVDNVNALSDNINKCNEVLNRLKKG